MIGDKIKLLREARGLTQQQISQDPDFGIKQGTLSAYERNAREPNVETIRKIAEYFGVTADYLIGISEHKTAEHDAVGQIIPLSDAAIDSLRTYDDTLLATISSVLSASAATEFFRGSSRLCHGVQPRARGSGRAAADGRPHKQERLGRSCRSGDAHQLQKEAARQGAG